MGLEKLKKAIEADELVQSRETTISINDDELVVREYGNPALEVQGTEIVETGEEDLTQRVQDIANEVLGLHNYVCSTYPDTEQTRTKISL